MTLLFHWVVCTCAFTLLSSMLIETKELNIALYKYTLFLYIYTEP